MSQYTAKWMKSFLVLFFKKEQKKSASFEKEAKLFHPLRILGVSISVGIGLCGAARAGDMLCRTAILAAEPAAHLPPHLLAAIALAESGRVLPGSGAVIAWPWTIDINGVGRMFDSKAEAIAAVQEAQQSGMRSIDVGCMQINLFYHPLAFATLDDAFDPAANVAYAVRFLGALHQQTGDWAAAIAAYHSATPERGGPYAQRVAALWPEAARFGLYASSSILALTAENLARQVDPTNTLTPEFRAERIKAAAFRQAQLASVPAGVRPNRVPTIMAREDEVDPKHNLTPEFRAQVAAATALRHRPDAAKLLVAGLGARSAAP